MEPVAVAPCQRPGPSGNTPPPPDPVENLDEPGVGSNHQGVSASSLSPPSPTSFSSAEMLAELNTGVPATLSIPMTCTQGVVVPSPTLWWVMHSAACEGGLPLSLVRAVAEFEGLAWPSCDHERKAMVKRISKVTSCNASHGFRPFGAIQADKITGRTLWLCYAVQAVEFRPNPAGLPPSMKGSITAWNPSFGMRLWHFYSARVRVGGLAAFLNASDAILDNRATGRVVNRMHFHHHASFVANVFSSHPIAGVTECTDLHGDCASMHTWLWLVVKNQAWQAHAQYDTTRIQSRETAHHLEHANARSLVGDPYDSTIGMIVTTRFASEAPLPLVLWGDAMIATSTMESDSNVALLRGSSIRRVIVTDSEGRSFDVSIPKSLLMVGAEFPTTGDVPTF